MIIAKAKRRAWKQSLIREVQVALERTAMGKGVPGFCAGARPAQIRAGAKVVVDRALALKHNPARTAA